MFCEILKIFYSIFCYFASTFLRAGILFFEFGQNIERVGPLGGFFVEFGFELENLSLAAWKIVDNQGNLLHGDGGQVDFAVGDDIGHFVVKFKRHFAKFGRGEFGVKSDFEVGFVGFDEFFQRDDAGLFQFGAGGAPDFDKVLFAFGLNVDFRFKRFDVVDFQNIPDIGQILGRGLKMIEFFGGRQLIDIQRIRKKVFPGTVCGKRFYDKKYKR